MHHSVDISGRSLKAMVRASNTVLSDSFCKRWQHLADTLMSIKAIPDEDKGLAKLLTGYQDMVCFLHVHKVAQTNSQVPVIPEASTFPLKLQKRRSLVLEQLNQAPVDGSSSPSSGASRICLVDFSPSACFIQNELYFSVVARGKAFSLSCWHQINFGRACA